MANTKNDADTPKTGAVKKWNPDAERDLCLAMLMSNNGEIGKVSPDWNATHTIMIAMGYEFTKDAMTQRWSKTLLKDFKTRHKDSDFISGASAKKTPAKRKKATDAAAAAAAAAEAEADTDAALIDDATTAAAAATPPTTPTPAKGRKRAPAKPKAAGPAKPRGRKPKSAETVKAEDEDEEEQPAPAKPAVENKGPEAGANGENTEEAEQDQPSPAKKTKVEPQEDTEMADEA